MLQCKRASPNICLTNECGEFVSLFYILGRQRGRNGVLLVCGLCDCARMEDVHMCLHFVFVYLFLSVFVFLRVAGVWIV